MMTGEKHTDLIRQIQECCSDVATASPILAELSTDYAEMLSNSASSLADIETLKADNEKLRNANMKLFLQVGEKAPEKKPEAPEDKELSFEELFDEKGVLK